MISCVLFLNEQSLNFRERAQRAIIVRRHFKFENKGNSYWTLSSVLH